MVQEAVQEAMELVPYDKPTIHFLPAYLDIDMFFVPLDVAEMGHISNFWSSTAGATLKIYSERPPYLQLFSHPVALFVPVPDAHQVQEYKQLLCTALYKKGVEIPLPTSPPFQNYFNGSNVAKRTIKVTAAQAQAALETLGVEVVWAAQFGGKTPLEIWKTLFSNLLPKPMAYPMAFDLGSQSPDPQHICLLGLQGGKATLDIFGGRYKAYIHPILPGMFDEDDPMVWGTLEVRREGGPGSEVGKFVQAYSPVSHLIKATSDYAMAQPTSMKQLRCRKVGLMNLVDTITCNLAKVGGVRLEVRARPSNGTAMEETLRGSEDIMEELCHYISHPESPLVLKQIPLQFYRDFIRKELKGALEGATFSGMRDSGPTPEQLPIFAAKVQQWAWLLSNIGFASGQFKRFIKNGVSCQNLVAPKRAARPPSTPKTPKRHPRPSHPQLTPQRDTPVEPPQDQPPAMPQNAPNS